MVADLTAAASGINAAAAAARTLLNFSADRSGLFQRLLQGDVIIIVIIIVLFLFFIVTVFTIFTNTFITVITVLLLEEEGSPRVSGITYGGERAISRGIVTAVAISIATRQHSTGSGRKSTGVC